MSVLMICTHCGAESPNPGRICPSCGARSAHYVAVPMAEALQQRQAANCRLTWDDFRVLESYARQAGESEEHIARTARAKLARSRIVQDEDIGPDLVTLNSRIVFQIANQPPRTRTLVSWRHRGGNVLNLPLNTPHGIALLGLSAGCSGLAWHADGRSEPVRVVSVDYQPEAAQRAPDPVAEAPARHWWAEGGDTANVISLSDRLARSAYRRPPPTDDDPGPLAG